MNCRRLLLLLLRLRGVNPRHQRRLPWFDWLHHDYGDGPSVLLV
jgi:hypothetical protein